MKYLVNSVVYSNTKNNDGKTAIKIAADLGIIEYLNSAILYGGKE